MENSLPDNWIECRFGDVARIHNGYAFSSKDFKRDKGVPLIKQSQLNGDKVDLTKCVYLDARFLETKKDFVLRKGDVLIGMSGSVGKMCLYDLDFPALQNQRTGKAVPLSDSLLSKKLFWYFLSTIERVLLEKGKGLGVANVSAEDIEGLPFNLPPLPEQHRIVAKLDAVMQKVEANKQRLDKIPKLLKRFRQSVLAAAVSGRLTEEWRKINKTVDSAEILYGQIQTFIDKRIQKGAEEAKRRGTRKPKDHRNNKRADFHVTELEQLPDGWGYYRLEELTYLVSDGTHHTPTYKSEGVKFLSVKNVRPFRIKDGEIKYISKDQHKEINSRCNPEKGDILYTKVGATYGYACINNLDYPFSIFVSLALIKPVYEFVDSKFLEAVMNSETVFKQARERVSGIGTPDLHLIEIRDFKIPLCSNEEQKEIVRRIEQLFSFADKLEARYTKAQAMLDRLPQSILAKAFRGELVAQDPEDEAASALLERIREEKINSEQISRKKPTN